LRIELQPIRTMPVRSLVPGRKNTLKYGPDFCPGKKAYIPVPRDHQYVAIVPQPLTKEVITTSKKNNKAAAAAKNAPADKSAAKNAKSA